MTRAMTTIDFCEKALKKATYDNMLYDIGLWGNIKAVLGPNPFLFLLPLSSPAGDGLSYVTESSRLIPETTQQARSRKKGHNFVQRSRLDPEGGGSEQSGGRYAATENYLEDDDENVAPVG